VAEVVEEPREAAQGAEEVSAAEVAREVAGAEAEVASVPVEEARGEASVPVEVLVGVGVHEAV